MRAGDIAVEHGRSIFRAEAVARHARSRERVVFPRPVAPPAFACLWLLAAILVAGIGLAWWARVPVSVGATAVVLDETVSASLPANADTIIVGHADQLGELQPGQAVVLPVSAIAATAIAAAPGTRHPARVVAVEPAVVGPAAAAARFGLSGAGAAAFAQPSAVALARLSPDAGVDRAVLRGSVFAVQVETGSRRVLSYLPWVGGLVGG